MEFPEERYYGMNRILLSTMGLWPYDNFKIRHIRLILSLSIIMSVVGTQWMKLFVSEYSSDLLLKVLSYNMIFIICSIKYISFYAVYENIKEFRERVRNNWDALKDNREIEIICKHGMIGKLLAILLIIFVCSLCTICIFSQYISIFLDIITPLNISRPRKLLFAAEYFIDQEKYFYIITIHIIIGLVAASICVTATETFSLTNALHAFGLFKVARIIAAVDFHRRAIEFSELLKGSFGRAYLILFVLGVCSASINLFNLSRIIMAERDILEIIKSIFLLAALIIYLILANYAGQEFINNDTHFYCTICNTEWYNTPLKTQKLILFLMQKTTKCYKVDAGGMFDPCLEGLATSLSMSVSYFMVLYSV
ncbi:uncharacterized protein LOC143895456 isoform X3 [Temnothorax americanus]|uniref:uncharacterized protein LOC143895456 isoform X3 n=1 Tax=Temnothorax americanus TaxID=1964332 RepID=UPI004069334B